MTKNLLSKLLSATLVVILTFAALPALPARAATAVDIFDTPGTYTWVAPPDVTSVNVEAWGGGGRGGNFVLVFAETVRGGGGGGAYSSSTVPVVPGNTYTVVVGAGATALAAAGGDSYFDTPTTVMAKGGNSATTATGATGGSAAAGFGTIKFSGGAGANGNAGANYSGGGGSSAGTGANGATATNATGASAPAGGGNGGNGRAASTGAGIAGSTPGGGGGGAYNLSGFNAGQAGGNGANGSVILTYTSDYRIFSNPGSFTWTAPPGATSVNVEAWGGGGRGGNFVLVFAETVRGGGGGGAYSSSTVPVVPGNTYTVVVGAGATALAAAGGDSYFDTPTTVMAKGGNSATTATGATGGSAAAGFGTIKFSGGAGANGNAGANYSGGGGSSAGTGANGATATNATGASAPAGGGNGGNGRAASTGAGIAGSTPGGGGGGAYHLSGFNAGQAGGNGANGSVVLTINSNTPPTGGNGSVTTNEDTTYTFTVADFTALTTPPYADAESDPFSGVRVTSLETAGTLQCGGVDLNLNDSCADVTTLTFTPDANANGSPYATFQFQVYDGTAYSAGSYTMTVNVTDDNDTPTEAVAPDQYKTDATTVIPQGSTTNETSVVFKATATDIEGDQYNLEVEAVDDSVAFADIATCTSPPTNSGLEASTGSCGPFVAGSYKWQYRFVDSGGASTAWTPFSGSDPDFIVDPVLLVVVTNGINSNPDTGDGSIAEGEAIPTSIGAITQILVEFNKDVYNPAGTGGTDDVDNPNNYILLYSSTSSFNTPSCAVVAAGGVVAPDIPYPISSVSYDNGGGSSPYVATLTLTTPLTLPGYYRLYICGTTSIVQASNPAFALAGDGVAAGTDFTRNFQLVTPSVGDGDGNGRGGDDTKTSARDLALLAGLLPATGFAPDRVTVLPEQPADLAYTELGDLWIEIPALGVKEPIVGVPQTAEGEWDVTWLANNIGWLDGTAFPSWEGNSVLTAHVTNADGLDGPFAKLSKLKYGDQIIVHLNGEKYTFEVRNSRLARPYSTSFAFEHLEEQSYLTLITCQYYVEKSDTYLFRRVVRAVLVKVENE